MTQWTQLDQLERNMRKHGEIDDPPVSDDPEYIRMEVGFASRRSEEAEIPNEYVKNMQFLTNQTNAALQSVGLQLRGANTTFE